MQRRHFLGQLVSGTMGVASLAGINPAWARAGAPDFITAGNKPDNSTWLVGLSADGAVMFEIPIPGRGHAAAVNPKAPEAVAFARRPGRFAMVIDCATSKVQTRLESPDGRHFYGHGAFSADGHYLFTPENDYDGPAGVLGIWNVKAGYVRVAEISSGGIGPHEILHRPEGGFVVANGGIQTHPDMDRAKLNLPDMQPNLTYLSETGEITQQVELPAEMHKNSIRHIALDGAGGVVAALQWQGNPLTRVPLVMRHRPGTAPELLAHPDELKLQQFAGSIAVCGENGEIAVTGPKGSHVLYFNRDGTPAGSAHHGTASGVAAHPEGGMVITCEGGMIHRLNGSEAFIPIGSDWAWDNHLVAISNA